MVTASHHHREVTSSNPIEDHQIYGFSGVWTCDLAMVVRRCDHLSYKVTDNAIRSFKDCESISDLNIELDQVTYCLHAPKIEARFFYRCHLGETTLRATHWICAVWSIRYFLKNYFNTVEIARISLTVSIVYFWKSMLHCTKRQVKFFKIVASQCLSPPCVSLFLWNFDGRRTRVSILYDSFLICHFFHCLS